MTHHLDVRELIDSYESGISVQGIADARGVSHSVIKKRLLATGVQLRTFGDQRRLDLARNPEIPRGRPRVHPINEAYFGVRTASMAYVVGFLQADGYNNLGRGQIKVTLKVSDADHLTAIAREMGADRPLFLDALKNPTLALYSKRLSEGLAKWGVVSPKSLTASTHQELLNDRDYWRGVVDGDGSLCVRERGRRVLSLVGSNAICTEFLDFCRAQGARTRSRVHASRNVWSAALSGDDASLIASVLYGGASLALPRKRALAAAWAA